MTASNLALYSFIILAGILLAFAFLVLWKIFRGDIALDDLLSEPPAPGQSGPPKASLSRFQFLIFTFVIA